MRASRRLRRWTLLALLLAIAPVIAAQPEAASPATRTQATPVDAGWVIERLARPTPMRTEFLELRGSAMLKAPLRIVGEYQRPDADTLVRAVRSPYLETTTIRQGEVSIARDGKSARKFSLSRAPELAALQHGFGAMLSGDRQQLERHYRVASSGTRAQWTLNLAPKDAQVAAKLEGITLRGRGAELRCIETRSTGAEAQRTLLAGAARAAANVADAAQLAALCRGDSATQ